MFFDIINDNKGLSLSVKPETLTINVFKELWDRDKSKNKENAINDFSYIYHSCDFNSPYSSYIENEREKRVIDEVIGDKKYKPDNKVFEGCKIYKELIKTPITRMFITTQKKVNEMVEFVDTLEINEDNLKIMQDTVKNFTAFASSYKELEALVKKEREGIREKIKGDKQVNKRYSE